MEQQLTDSLMNVIQQNSTSM